MKKSLLALLLCCIFVLGACSSSDNGGNRENNSGNDQATEEANVKPQEEDGEGEDEEDSAPSASSGSVDVTEQVLLDESGIVITAKSLSNSLFGPSLDILVENNSDTAVTVQVRNTSINDFMVESMFSCDVDAGKKANDDITFMSSYLDKSGIDVIKDIEFYFHVFDSSSWDTIFDSETIQVSTTADPSYVQPVDDSGTVLYNDNGFKIVYKELDMDGNFLGPSVILYAENNSDTDATIQVRESSLNGFMVDSIFSCELPAGKKAVDSITFMSSELENNDITTLENMEFSFHVFSSSGWDTLFDTDKIEITF